MDSPGCGERTERTWTSSALTAVVVACTTSPCATYRTGMTNWTGFAVGAKVSSDRAVFIEPTSSIVRSECTITDSKHEATSLGAQSGVRLRGKLVRCARVRGGAPLTRAQSWKLAGGQKSSRGGERIRRVEPAPQRSPAATSGRDQGRAACGEPATTGRPAQPGGTTSSTEGAGTQPVRPFASFTRRKPGSSSSTRTVVPSWISKWLALLSPGPSRAETDWATTTAAAWQ